MRASPFSLWLCRSLDNHFQDRFSAVVGLITLLPLNHQKVQCQKKIYIFDLGGSDGTNQWEAENLQPASEAKLSRPEKKGRNKMSQHSSVGFAETLISGEPLFFYSNNCCVERMLLANSESAPRPLCLLFWLILAPSVQLRAPLCLVKVGIYQKNGKVEGAKGKGLIFASPLH